MARPSVDDALWARIEPLLPKPRRRRVDRGGSPRIPDRVALAGILFVLRGGPPWQMLPREIGCGSGSTCWRRLVAWQRAGVWQRLHEVLLAELGRRGQLDLRWTVIDSGTVRAARGRKNPQPIAAMTPSRISSGRGIAPVLPRRRTLHGSRLGVVRWVVERTLAWLHRFRRGARQPTRNTALNSTR